MMKDTDETHKLTETIYRGLTENFTPGVRQIILAGKVYHKALVGVASAARTYNEVLLRVGQTARTTCKGGTEDIGQAIYQIAEAHKEIQTRIEENTKALYAELILPLEQKLENDFKRSAAQHRKYTQGHKAVISPYIKANDSLKRFRKKTKNKVVYDDQKEGQYIKALERCHERLHEYRVQGLKLALLEDRKCHCFLLDRLSTVTNLYGNHHKQSADILLAGLPQWRQLSSRPQILPPEAERLLYQFKEDNDNDGIYWENGHLPGDTRSLGSPYRRSNSAHDVHRRPISEYASPEGFYTGNFGAKTMPHSRGISVPPAAPPGGIQVRAIYSHVGEGDQKLSFTEGDLLNVIGDQADGWQYGLNTRSGQFGWFPLSFTEPSVSPPREPPPVMNGRVKSMGDLLDSRSLSEHADFYLDDVPGRTSRPKSMYEGSNLRLVNSTNQNGGSYTSRQQQSQPPPAPPPPIPQTGPPKMSHPTPPAADYNTEEDREKYKKNPKFSGVQLRKTETRDRSGPRV